MAKYVEKAVFVYSSDSKRYLPTVENNGLGVTIEALPFEELQKEPKRLAAANHVVVSGNLSVVKTVFTLAIEYGFSVGLVPSPSQRTIAKVYDLPVKVEEALEVALRADPIPMDIITCNGEIMLFKATVGSLPVIDSPLDMSMPRLLFEAVKGLFRFKLLPFNFVLSGDRSIETAACGCMIVQRHENTLASRLIAHDSSVNDGMISLIVSSPFSVIEYIKFIVSVLKGVADQEKIPSVGYIKTPKIRIESKEELPVYIDGEAKSHTPLGCETLPGAIRFNMGKALREDAPTSAVEERVEIKHRPEGRILYRADRKGKVPFFPAATEDRYHDLFTSLRQDARLDSIYLVLIVLSTMLATVGLFQNSVAVIIGAMLLAPLMAPIVSMSMGLLRHDTKMLGESLKKIGVGVVLSLLASGLLSLIFPGKAVTAEMQARVNPGLLDLGVALIAGVASAYAKAHKEIMESLAGVAIAVALIPPLAVAGIGLGMGDIYFFSQAFLLFFTNLIGITLAATFTFRLLGYSAVIVNKRGVFIVLLLTALVAVPLFITTKKIITIRLMERRWSQQRFLVNNKYLIVKEAKVVYQHNRRLLFLKVLVRQGLTRKDLNLLKRKIEANFDSTLDIRIQLYYIT